jgi:hypothetical protein
MHRAYDAGKEVRQILKGVREALDRVPYPYPAAILGAQGGSDTPTIRAFLGPSSGAIDIDTAGVYNYGIESLSKIRSLEGRILASLVTIIEQVETALGLPPLPDPPGEADQGPTGQASPEDRVG